MERETLGAALKGALAGSLATLPMTAAMLAARRAGWLRLQPPEQITRKALTAVAEEEVDEPTRRALSLLDHFAFGGAAGALFGVVHRKLRLPVAASTQGIFFGVLVWLVSYEGWVPALGIMPPVQRDEPGRPAAMVVAHVIYGAVLGGLLGEPPRRARREEARPT